MCNPYSFFGLPNIWPRGYPLDQIKAPECTAFTRQPVKPLILQVPHSFPPRVVGRVCQTGATCRTHSWPGCTAGRVPFCACAAAARQQPGVPAWCQIRLACACVQGLADVDPDVDAIYRLTQKLGVNFAADTASVVLPEGVMCTSFHMDVCLVKCAADTFIYVKPQIETVGWCSQRCPWNSQNTLFEREALWGLLIPVTTTFRVCDIWRSYWVQVRRSPPRFPRRRSCGGAPRLVHAPIAPWVARGHEQVAACAPRQAQLELTQRHNEGERVVNVAGGGLSKPDEDVARCGHATLRRAPILHAVEGPCTTSL